MRAKLFLLKNVQSFFLREYAKKAADQPILTLGKKVKKLLAEGPLKKSTLDVEKNTKVLVREVCGTNLLANEGENVKIKADSEYPDWLWNVHLGKQRDLEEMDPNTKEYWNLVKYLALKKKAYLDSIVSYKTVHK